LIACLPVTVMAETTVSFAGRGTSSDPYKIETAEQLQDMRDFVNRGDGKNDAGKYFVLTADIDLGGQEWTPIGFTEGTNKYAFTGTFDGDGHVIKNFKITEVPTFTNATATALPEGTTTVYCTNVGLFGAVQGGTIKNLGVEDVSITVDNKPDKSAIHRVGALVGRLAGTVTNCYAKNITCRKLDNCAGTNMSGFIGVLRGKSTITDCYVNGFDVDTAYTNIITANAFVDAAEGKNNESVITNCYVVNAIKNRVTKFYAFAVEGKGGDKAPTLNNCWSTAVDGSEAKANYSRGNLGATKAGVVAAMTGVSGYQINDAINDGFPSLRFETVEEDRDYVVAAVVPGDKVYVKLIANNNVSGAQVYVATYDSNGRLLDVDVAEVVSPYEFTTNVSTSGAYTVKVFVWNGNKSPLADAYEGKFINGELVNTDELSYSISNGVMTIEYANDIADYASFNDTPWSGETTVTKIVLGSNVTGIGANAFSGFTNLESIEIPEAVETIADNALPNTDFTIYGYANGAADEYAEENGKKFQLKKLRILTIGNSHTLDHGQWNKEIWGDIKNAGIETEIVYDRVTNGGFQMYYEDSKD
ncbi:MAG: leucine-rich repeat protein, partial [Clostridia bacterium]|nr:leucine-rich repeat protein [Clostridia bacterium]